MFGVPAAKSQSNLTGSTLPEVPKATDSAAIQDAQNMAERLPDDTITHSSAFLHGDDLRALALSNRHLHTVLQQNCADRLEPKFLGKGDPIRLYNDPACRKKQFICADQAGRDYLFEAGIYNPVWIGRISDVNQRDWTVANVLALIDAQTERIENQHPGLSDDRIALLIDNSGCPYLLKGLLTEAQILALSDDQVQVLNNQHVQNALNQGLLTIKQALRMTVWGMYALELAVVRREIKTGRMPIEAIVHLSAEGWAMHDTPAAKKYIGKNMLTLFRVVQMSAVESNDLLRMNVQKQLDCGALTMQRFFEMTHEERVALR